MIREIENLYVCVCMRKRERERERYDIHFRIAANLPNWAPLNSQEDPKVLLSIRGSLI